MAPTALDQNVVTRAQSLRKSRTCGEKAFWNQLKLFRKNYRLHVRQQVPKGPYIADLAIHAKKLIIEIDGEHHQTAGRLRKDKKRDEWFAKQGYRVLRFSTGDLIENMHACVETTLRAAGIDQ